MELLEVLKQQFVLHSWQKKKIIVALSGGVDSMCLAVLLQQLQITDLILAHCNFGLRGKESDEDENMIRKWADEMSILLKVKHFDTPKILAEQGGNLQDSARKLRYEWFEELRKEQGFDYIAVAHHREDAIETMLINFFKGTGIAGLHGILPQQGKVIRPLLSFQKSELKLYAQNQKIPWREDSSNAKDTYLRNQIRHQLWPIIEAVFPNAENALIGNVKRFSEVEILYQEAIDGYRKTLLEKRQKDWYIPILKLKKCRPITTILFELLKPFGFSTMQIAEVLSLLEAESGKWVSATQYRVIKDRQFLIITAHEPKKSSLICIDKIENEQLINWDGGELKIAFRKIDKIPQSPDRLKGTRIEVVSLNEADFPLYLRPIRQGDFFYPLGMKRKKKKIGRFLRDLKIPLHEKENVWVLESQKRIICVLGYRIDERFKIKKPMTHGVVLKFKRHLIDKK